MRVQTRNILRLAAATVGSGLANLWLVRFVWVALTSGVAERAGRHDVVRQDSPGAFWVLVAVMSLAAVLAAALAAGGCWALLRTPGEDARIDSYLRRRREAASPDEPIRRRPR